MNGEGTTRPRTLAEVVGAIATELPEATATATATATAGRREWSRGRLLFAVLDGGVLEVRLDGPIAAAALRTPDTSLSARGMPWVRFAPPELDAQAIDRATAWFGLAYRRAGMT